MRVNIRTTRQMSTNIKSNVLVRTMRPLRSVELMTSSGATGAELLEAMAGGIGEALEKIQ